jgi:hypothetical protein
MRCLEPAGDEPADLDWGGGHEPHLVALSPVFIDQGLGFGEDAHRQDLVVDLFGDLGHLRDRPALDDRQRLGTHCLHLLLRLAQNQVFHLFPAESEDVARAEIASLLEASRDVKRAGAADDGVVHVEERRDRHWRGLLLTRHSSTVPGSERDSNPQML